MTGRNRVTIGSTQPDGEMARLMGITPPAAPTVPAAGPGNPATAQVPNQPTGQPAQTESSELSKSATAPKWTTMVPVGAKLRPDQVSALTELRRTLSRARVDKTERMTDNTLIRVAVDALLARAGELAGDTEAQLLASLLADDADPA